ncbi:hypothetical protein BHF70_05800 [Anaerostipes sp. 494a]|uniref:hypothetical protein n=1 Tax=Anaerostipes sp. 494a TaxID=1261636 RepID=UPI0009510167|nr:hypothetical protein [Anaerostipes sp. 494a]OLR59179.1 hypothetical protein BHF70_05800 [Anaerostipes sp. 494a]
MKKVYQHPQVVVEEFAPNEYVAACGESGTTYLFNCNAGGGAKGDVYTNDGQNLTQGTRSYYHACSKKHEASSTEEFINGYYIQNGGNDKKTHTVVDSYFPFQSHEESYPTIPVIIWTDGGTNVHATTDLDQNSWETAKS